MHDPVQSLQHRDSDMTALLQQLSTPVLLLKQGLHYATSWLHKIEKALMLETDPSEVLNEMIEATRKVGPL